MAHTTLATRLQQDASSPVVQLPEAATRLGVSLKTVRRMIARGTLPCFRVGSRLVVATTAIERVLAEGAINYCGEVRR
jgi:excisionase family DNA binding protein